MNLEQQLRPYLGKVLSGMISYLDCDPSYTDEDVDAAEEILKAFIRDLEKTPRQDKNAYILGVVKKTVMSLNGLNDRCGGELIETDQREDICAMLIEGSRMAGLETDVYDITEDWREW